LVMVLEALHLSATELLLVAIVVAAISWARAAPTTPKLSCGL